MSSLLRLATILRAGQLFAHEAHNCAKGPTFFADHAFLGDVYSAYESDYDDVIERYIGMTGECPDVREIVSNALELLEGLTDPWEGIIVLDKSLCAFASEYCSNEKVSEGCKQLVGEICNKAEKRTYLINRRIAD